MQLTKVQSRTRRHARVRAKILGGTDRPRLVVFRSLKFNYAQLVDDQNHVILVSSSDQKSKAKGTKTEKAKQVGLDLAKKALEKNISEIVFDRSCYKYHGRVKALADGAREGGLKF
ncbi:MAG: 50S ribosomal protein L18 [Candidatus Gracilibacteria bacterium]